MKKIIIVILIVAVMAGLLIARAEFDKNHYSCFYMKPYEEFDDGIAKGTRWKSNGVERIYSFDELRAIAENNKISLSGLLGGDYGLVIQLREDLALFIPGLGLDSGLSTSYGIF